MRLHYLIPSSAGLATILLLMGCGDSNNSHGNKTPKSVTLKKTYQGTYPIRVTCTTGMVADLVRKIGGPKVEVDQLMGADVDPHTYQATAQDVSKLGGAELIFYNGLHLEGKMGEIFENLSRKIP